MTKPFDFTGSKESAASEVARFEREAGAWKPAGLDQEYALRLDYYLHRQGPDIEATIKERYKKTWQDVLPHMETLPITRHFVNEQAKVFLNGLDMPLVDEDPEPAPDESAADEVEDAPEDVAEERWAKVVEESGLALKLKQVDRYTTLQRTCFLVLNREEGKPLDAQIYLPQLVDVVFDPAAPFDLDRAYGVRLRIGGSEKLADGKTRSRFAFWCARPEAPQYRVIWSDGVVEQVPGNDKGEVPFATEDGLPILPIVMFTAHTEELGPFTNANQGLHLFNRVIDVMATDLNHGAISQYFGQITISYPQGAEKSASYEIGPSRAMELMDGAQASILAPSPQIGAMVQFLDQKLKRQAVTAGIPPGSISLEARAVASGVALQIEMRPLMEARTDAIDIYRRPMRRLWDVVKAVYDARETTPVFKGRRAEWHPGEIQMPESMDMLIERLLVLRRAGWIGDVQAVAQLFKVDDKQAEELLREARKSLTQVEPVDPEQDPGDPVDPAMMEQPAEPQGPQEDGPAAA